MNRNLDVGSSREPPDKLEIWARRTGRVIGYAALLILALYLLFAYGPR